MDAQQFLAEFGHIANAPGGVARLREMIRAFAVRGDLIQHFAPWRECTLGCLGDWAIGCGFPKQEQGQEGNDILFAKVSDMNLPGNEKFIANTVNTITKETSERLRIKIHPPGTVIFPKIGGAISTNKRRIVSRPTAIDNNCLGLIPKGEATTEWLFLVLSSIDFSQYQVGTSVPALSQGIIAEIQCFLPSEEEQARIVAKVDELMALCDKLEAQQQQRRLLQNNLRQSTLQAVASATNSQELRSAWNRVTDNFGQLFHEPEDITSLKSLILGLAVRGLVVEQNSADTPAKELLKSIDSERRKLIKAKKLKASVAWAPASTADLPYQLPKGWVLARVIDLVDVGTGATPAKSEPSYYGGDIPWYTSSATNDKFAKHPEQFITQKAIDETNCKVFPSGSLIVALYGQGKTRGQISELLAAGATNQALAAMVFFESSLGTKKYLKYFFEKIYDEIRLQAEGGPQPNLNVGKIKETLIPVPPLEEQHRIVAKLDQLLSICDQLSNKFRSSNTVAKKLAVASIASISGITAKNEENEPVKVPQTELIAPLRLGQAPDIKAQAPLATILARHNGAISAKDLYQRFGGEIDAFYAQLKTEVNHGWILEPEVAEMREKFIDRASA